MEILKLDFSKCKYIGELHKVMKDVFKFPEYYGENLDALWDCLDGYCSTPLHIYVYGVETLPKELFPYIEKVLEIFDEVHEENKNIIFEIIS